MASVIKLYEMKIKIEERKNSVSLYVNKNVVGFGGPEKTVHFYDA